MREEHQRQVRAIAGTTVAVSEPAGACPLCGGNMGVQKTLIHWGVTLEHGRFRIHETVHVCTAGCRHAGKLATRRPSSLAELLPPRSVIGYDVMVHVGFERFVHHRQRAEISAVLEADYGIALSSGEISELGRRFLIYLETLHRTAAPALKAALQADGGWPLHVDASGEDGRGTLLVAFAGWRRWVLGAWKIPTERADAILPRLQDVVSLFGAPCAIMRDLGRAVTEAAQGLVEALDMSIPILACHYHFLADIGKDLLGEAHDKLRELFRQTGVRAQLRAIARDLGRSLGKKVEQARKGVLLWQEQTNDDPRIPAGPVGIATVRALAQWALDFPADGSDEGFPFDLPYQDLYDRCLQISHATETFLYNPPDSKVKRALERLQRTLRPIACDIPPFVPVATTLKRRAGLFQELRKALRLIPEPDENKRTLPPRNDAAQRYEELCDIRAAVNKLAASLRKRRPERGPANETRRAIDIVLSHLEIHGPFLWGHAIEMHGNPGTTVSLVDRTNDELEGFFHSMKHGERRRSGRKILTQDFEQIPPAAALAKNLTHPDYVEILCGTLDSLPRAFAKLDQENRGRSLAAKSAQPVAISDIECASLNSVDRRLVRTKGMDQCIMTAALSGHGRRATA